MTEQARQFRITRTRITEGEEVQRMKKSGHPRRGRGRFTKPRTRVALRMAPLIDIVFLLLLFFFVAARWRPQEDFLPFKLPTTQAGAVSLAKPEPLLIKIAAAEAGCTVEVANRAQVTVSDKSLESDLAAMLDAMQAYMLATKRVPSDPVEISCEADVTWQHLARIYNCLYGAGMTDITFWMTE